MDWKESIVSFADYDDTGSVCVGELTTRAKKLRADILRKFPSAKVSDSPECRKNTASTSKQSIHGDGRALDIFASKSILDSVADWLVGRDDLQMIIYDRFYIQKKSRGVYRGPNPHTDHIHVEVSKGDLVRDANSTSSAGTLVVLLFVALAFSGR